MSKKDRHNEDKFSDRLSEEREKRSKRNSTKKTLRNLRDMLADKEYDVDWEEDLYDENSR